MFFQLHADPAFPHLAWCSGRPAGSIIALLFMTGLVGGFAHCGPMCGAFVVAQTAGDPASCRLLSIKRGLLLPYHFGRTLTYTVLGVVVAGLGNGIIAASPLQLAVSLLLAFAALMFIGQAVERLVPGMFPGGVEVLAAGLGCRLARLSRPLLEHRSTPNRFALGLVLGFLPCGFLYAALASAAATGSAPAGAAAMAGFALGTVPSLMLVGIGGAAIASRWRGLARRLAAPLYLLNGTVLMVMAFSALSSN